MRKLRTKEELERRKKINNRIISTLMLALLVVSTLGFAFSSSIGFTSRPSSAINNSQSITNITSDKITIKYQGQIFSLASPRSSLLTIPVDVNKTPEDYLSKILYTDISNQQTLQEISLTLGRFASRIQPACYGKCQDNLPEKDCTENIIIWRESEKKRVYQNNSCIFIEGDISSADAFINTLFSETK